LVELESLRSILTTTWAGGDDEALVNAVVDETREATRTQVCSLYLWDEPAQRLVLMATNGLAKEGVGLVKMRMGQGVTGWVAKHRRPLVVPDTRKERRFHWIPGLDQAKFTSMLSVPVLAGAHLVGVINVQTEQTHHFSGDEVALLSEIANHVAGIVDRGPVLK
jgi:phosphotransferase system enzyme I (PtsP)